MSPSPLRISSPKPQRRYAEYGRYSLALGAVAVARALRRSTSSSEEPSYLVPVYLSQVLLLLLRTEFYASQKSQPYIVY